MNTTSIALLNKYTESIKNLNGQQLQEVIVQALEAEGLYVFAEFLELDEIKLVSLILF